MDEARSLDDVIAELSNVQEMLLGAADEDFATRAELSNHQDALRQEARDLRLGVADDMTIEQLGAQIEVLEDEIIRHLDTRPSASAGLGGGGQSGGGIDPNVLHEMHAKMAKSFGLEEKREQLRRLKLRLAELEGD